MFPPNPGTVKLPVAPLRRFSGPVGRRPRVTIHPTTSERSAEAAAEGRRRKGGGGRGAAEGRRRKGRRRRGGGGRGGGGGAEKRHETARRRPRSGGPRPRALPRTAPRRAPVRWRREEGGRGDEAAGRARTRGAERPSRAVRVARWRARGPAAARRRRAGGPGVETSAMQKGSCSMRDRKKRVRQTGVRAWGKGRQGQGDGARRQRRARTGESPGSRDHERVESYVIHYFGLGGLLEVCYVSAIV